MQTYANLQISAQSRDFLLAWDPHYFTQHTQRASQFLRQRARFAFRPDKGVNHRRHHGTNDDTQSAIANFHQVVHRAKNVFERGEREGDHHLCADIRRAFRAGGNPCAQQENRCQHKQQFDNIVQPGHDQ